MTVKGPAIKTTTIRAPRSKDECPPEKYCVLSLKTVAQLLDTTRTSARRWLKEAGIKPLAMGRGAKGAIRYKWKDIETWLESREYVE